MQRFHEFYQELLTAHDLLDHGQIHASDVHDRLVALLNRQETEARRDNGAYGAELYLRAKYAMAALADEILLRHDAAHAERWMDQLLEATLFHSQRAGEKVFDDIDEMQALGTAGAELARVYLAVLGLGFQGAYRGVAKPDEKIEPYRQKLFRIALGDPLVLSGRRRIAQAAYAATLTDGERGLLPHLKPWIAAIVLLVVVYVAAGAVMWRSAVADLDPIVTSILSLQKPRAGGSR